MSSLPLIDHRPWGFYLLALPCALLLLWRPWSALTGCGGTEPPAAGAPAPRVRAGGGPRPANQPLPPLTRGERWSLRSHIFYRLPPCGAAAGVRRLTRRASAFGVGRAFAPSLRVGRYRTPYAKRVRCAPSLGAWACPIGQRPAPSVGRAPSGRPARRTRGSTKSHRGPFIETAYAATSPLPTSAGVAFDETFPHAILSMLRPQHPQNSLISLRSIGGAAPVNPWSRNARDGAVFFIVVLRFAPVRAEFDRDRRLSSYK